MFFCDVILPLPLDGVFTYALPKDMQNRDLFGYRVLVPLGRSKTYTAMVVRCHNEKPQFAVRDILSVLDNKPMLLPQQYKLWQWISEYYMCALGDVYKAALPSGLKAEDGYKPRTEEYIGFGKNFADYESQQLIPGMLARAEKQMKLYECFLRLYAEGGVSREELLNESHSTAPILRSLITRGILCSYKVEVGRLGMGGQSHPENIHALSEAQSDAYNKIMLEFMKQPTVLFHGVTSCGKTEIYIHLIQQVIDRGEQALFLLPEIALSVQMMQRLRKVFGNRLGIYHSKYSDAERVEIWKKQMSDSPYDVILGVRSSVFLPFQRLGLVIVDEEHETSFKQQDPAPRYHARSAAIMLAQMYGAKVLLGTATPSMESYHNAKQGKYGLVELNTRYQDIELPEIEVVDIRDLRHRKIMKTPFSPQLIKAMREALENDKQIILFQNRRGFSQMIECHTCGWVPHCDNCDVSLTYHKTLNMLTCHYCGYTYAVPRECPCCETKDLRGRGIGTERIEDEIMDLFPEARIARMDLDTTRSKNAYDRIIGDFSEGKTNILIGTQMVTKGLDFANVSVVGILDADTMLNSPNFRAYEHAYAMMSQVAGRAGRKGGRGKVFLQTRNPQLPIIKQIVDNDFKGLYQELVEERNMFKYPPFYRLIYIYIKDTKESVAESLALELAGRLRQGLGNRILGPDKPSVSRVKQQSIRKIVLKLENTINLAQVRQYLRQIQQQTLLDKRYATTSIYYDVDPL